MQGLLRLQPPLALDEGGLLIRQQEGRAARRNGLPDVSSLAGLLRDLRFRHGVVEGDDRAELVQGARAQYRQGVSVPFIMARRPLSERASGLV